MCKLYDSILASCPWHHDAEFVKLGWTVSISTKSDIQIPRVTRKPGQGKLMNKPYRECTPREQHWYYINKYIPDVVQPNVDAYIASFELNKHGELHMHLCVAYHNPKFYDESYYLTDLRKSLLNNVIVRRLSKNNYSRCVALNYTHTLEKGVVDWLEYLIKDTGKLPFEIKHWNSLPILSLLESLVI